MKNLTGSRKPRRPSPHAGVRRGNRERQQGEAAPGQASQGPVLPLTQAGARGKSQNSLRPHLPPLERGHQNSNWLTG